MTVLPDAESVRIISGYVVRERVIVINKPLCIWVLQNPLIYIFLRPCLPSLSLFLPLLIGSFPLKVHWYLDCFIKKRPQHQQTSILVFVRLWWNATSQVVGLTAST